MAVIVWICLLKGVGEISYSLRSRDGKLNTWRNRIRARKILQDALAGE